MPAADVIKYPKNLVAFYPASIYRSVGSSSVLPELLRSVDKGKLSSIQFLSLFQHDDFPGLHDGNRLIKVTLIKDIPASLHVAGFDCPVWYRRHPAFCSVCKKLAVVRLAHLMAYVGAVAIQVMWLKSAVSPGVLNAVVTVMPSRKLLLLQLLLLPRLRFL